MQPFWSSQRTSLWIICNEYGLKRFHTLAFDPSFTGESGDKPRYLNSPDINNDDFCSVVDFLSLKENVDPKKIGVIGICGWGGYSINAAAIDPRIKAAVASTIYDMKRISVYRYNDTNTEEKRYETKKQLVKQRLEDYKNGSYQSGGGLPDKVPDDAPLFLKQYYDYYKTPRGYHKISLNSNNGWSATAGFSLMITKILVFANEIKTAVLVIHGELADSLYFSKTAFEKLKGDNKELMIMPGAYHCDMYFNLKCIPFDKTTEFMKQYLV